jgi:hypothetical protein
MQPQALDDWVKINNPSQVLLYKDNFWKQIVFVHDQIPAIACKVYGEKVATALPKLWIKVISEHTSQLMRLPVFHIKLPNGDEFVMRCNFHNWKISVKAKAPIVADFINLFDVRSKIYCEEFPPEWIFGSYSENPAKFMIEIEAGENYLFTFFWIYFQKVAFKRKI